MAGKTLLGIGNGARDSARGAARDAAGGQEESAGSNAAPTSLAGMASGPTLVDDEKVREGLRRLRSLDSSSHTRAPVDPLAASVARSLEALPSETARGGTPGPARLPALPSAAAARSLDNLVPLSEGGSGPHSSGTALVRRPETGVDRGTLVGRDLHLPPEFGGKGRAGEPSRELARATNKEVARDATRGRDQREPGRGTAPSQRPLSKQPPKLPLGVKPALPRGTKPAGRRNVGEETLQLRGRPNLAARIVIVLATAAAVALLGVAGIRWHRDDEVSNRPRPPTREWPSSETLPTHVGAAPADPVAAAGSEPRDIVRPATTVPPAPLKALPKGAAVGPTPALPAPKVLGTSERPAGSQPGTDGNEGVLDSTGVAQAILVSPSQESARRHHRRDKASEGGPSTAGGTAAAPAGALPSTTPANRETRPVKPRGGKDDPDSTLPLDLD